MSDLQEVLIPTKGKANVEEKQTADNFFEMATTAGTLCMMCDFNDGMFGSFFASWYYLQGINSAQVGIGFGFLAVGILGMAPVALHLVSKFGPNKVQFVGVCLFTLVRFVSGFAPLVPKNQLFIFLLATSLLTGMVVSTTETAASAWVIRSVDADRRTEANGILMTTRASANLIAPAVGGILFDLGGFMLPIMAGCALLVTFIIWKRDTILRLTPPPDRFKAINSGSIMRHPPIAILSFTQFLMFFMLSSGNVWFQPLFYFQYRVSASVFGIIMSALCVVFVIGASLVHNLQKTFGPIGVLMLGNVLIAFGYLWFGPTPILSSLLPSPSVYSVWEPVVGIIFTNFGYSIPMTAIAPMSAQYAMSAGWSESDAATQSAMYSVISIGVAVGGGPTLGGIMTNNFGVGVTCLAMAICFLTLFFAPLGLLKAWEATHGKLDAQDIDKQAAAGVSPTTL